jgi:hypothetical protein
LRSRKNELFQTHVEHGAGGRSDVPRVLGSGKDNCYILRRHEVNLKQVALAGYYFSGLFPDYQDLLKDWTAQETFLM